MNPASGKGIALGMPTTQRHSPLSLVLGVTLLAASAITLLAADASAQEAPSADEPPPAPPPPVDEPPPPPTTVDPEPPPPPPTTTAPPPPPPTTTEPPPATTAPPAPPPPRPPPTASPAPLKVAPSATAQKAPPPPPPASTPPKKDDDDDDDTNGLFGPFRIGPVVGVGVPNLVNFGVTAKLTRFLGFGVNVGVIPKVQLSLYGDATLSYQEYDAYGRLYPFGGSFFLGAGVGYATMKGSYANEFAAPPEAAPFGITPGTPITVNTDGSVRSLVLTPQLGFFKTWGSGISLGIDFGAQVPIAPSTVTANTSVSGANGLASTPQVQDQITQGSQKVRDTLDKVGQQIVPTINLKLGFLL